MFIQFLASVVVTVLGLVVTLLYSSLMMRNSCRVLLISLISTVAIAAFWASPLLSLIIMPLSVLALQVNRCSPWINSLSVVLGEAVMGVIYLEVVFGDLGKLLIIVPQVQFGYWYLDNPLVNAIGALSESVNSLLFMLMMVITLMPLWDRYDHTLHLALLGVLTLNPGDWVDLPTLPILSLAITPYGGLGRLVANLVVWAKVATVWVNYLLSALLGIILVRRMDRGFRVGDYVILLMILSSSIGDLLYFYRLTMIPRSMLIIILAAMTITLMLKDELRGRVRGLYWVVVASLTMSYLLYTTTIIESLNPGGDLLYPLLLALRSPVFLTPTLLTLLILAFNKGKPVM
ncbi:MAG: hypothetical protein RXQ94_01290 [Caldivirga sp.]